MPAAAVAGSGALLFALAALVERGFGLPAWAAGVVEEAGKAGLIAAFGFAALGSAERGAARGLSLGLAACAVFAAIENCAYFLAFPDAGTLARLAWSLPLHLDAALLSALGALPLLRLAEDRRGIRGLGRAQGKAPSAPPLALASRIALFSALAAAAAALHAFSNGLLSNDPPAAVLAAFPVAGIAALAVLASVFVDTAYIGGFLHGTEQGS